MRTILFLRHGITRENLERRYIGKSDPPLLKSEYTRLAPYADAHVKNVYISPKIRCVQTAQILFPNARQIPIQAFEEMDFGDFEGKTYDALKGDAHYCQWLKNPHIACPHGESQEDFVKRCTAAFLHLMACAPQQEEPLVLMVHGGTIMAILSALGKPGQEYFSYQTKPGQGFWAQWEEENHTLTHIRPCIF